MIIKEGRGKKEEGRTVGGYIAIFLFSFFFSPLSSILLLSSLAHADDIRDVKPPVSLPEFPWLVIVIVITALTALIFCLWYWFRLRRAYPKKVEIKSPWEIAYQRLQDLRERNLFGQGMVKEHFTELSDITRKYIEGRFDIHTPEMTTEEFLGFVKNSPLVETKHKEILKNFLRLADMVKFAKYGPSADEAVQSFELAKRFVDETKIENSPDSGGRKGLKEAPV
jgi:hypothetical protein